jgi:murein DD-endopeptidase MepM/ murein hydrolase activator NlpD
VGSRSNRLARLLAAVPPAISLVACSSYAPTVPPIATNAGRDISLRAEVRTISGLVARGATFASLLHASHVAEQDIAEATARAAAVFDLRKVRSSQAFTMKLAEDGTLRAFDYEIDGDRELRIARVAGELDAAVTPIEKTREAATVRGAIDRAEPSLFAAMEAGGGSVELSIGLAEIFGGDVDFNTELQPGDRFELLVDREYRADGHAFTGYGPILAARFENAGRQLRAFRYTPAGGDPGYYDERGVSMRRFFLKSPLKFEPVVTSAFSRSRFHPILHEYRAHLGVDYRAPAGAPVIAVADGVVVQAGMSGGSGRLVHLRHGNGYETEYLHLSSIAVRAGMRVRQGDVIGRVGASGLATGPHLDYRVKRNGLFINPVAANRAMPPADPIPAAELAAFREACTRAVTRLGR